MPPRTYVRTYVRVWHCWAFGTVGPHMKVGLEEDLGIAFENELKVGLKDDLKIGLNYELQSESLNNKNCE